ncbi:K(+)-transporting ATPase subunit F, partial [Pseudomonas sp. ANT_J28]|uniref:K(+)-transporting ATPase subunit F n=1 Tax=Pseudomonas sp. ANT_J28 TaxID=2597352 RepID=UPI001C498EF7
ERIHLFDFGVGSHHERLAPEKNREHSIADQQLALNVVFMDRIRLLAIGLLIYLITALLFPEDFS